MTPDIRLGFETDENASLKANIRGGQGNPDEDVYRRSGCLLPLIWIVIVTIIVRITLWFIHHQ